MGGAPDHRTVPDDAPCDVQRQIVLAQVQYVGPGRQRDVGAVVDCQQCAVAAGRIGQDLQRLEFVAGLQRAELFLACRPLVAELNQVHPAGQRRVGEFGQVTALPAGVGAQVEGGALQTVDR